MTKRILIIDDDESVRDAFTYSLKSTGYSTETADDGEKGIAIARENPPDLIFLDLNMPGMSGVEVMKLLQSVGQAIRICVVTAFYEEYMSQLREARDAGISFTLARKPMNPEQIRLVATSLLEGQTLEDTSN